MSLTNTDTKKVRTIVREETADMRKDISGLKEDVSELKESVTEIQLTMLTKEDAKNFLTKDDAKQISVDTAKVIMEGMRDQFKIFGEKQQFSDFNIKGNRSDIYSNKEGIAKNSYKILQNSQEISAIKK